MTENIKEWFKNDEELEKLISKGSRLYASKSYEDAAEAFGEACEVYSAKNEADDPLLLFWYGRALFNVAVSQSEVFGGSIQPEATNLDEPDYERRKKTGFFQFSEVHNEENGAESEEKNGNVDKKENENEKTAEDLAKEKREGKKRAQIQPGETGDADGGKDEGGDVSENEEQEEEEEKNDFELAWDSLDLARTLFQKQLESEKDETKVKKIKELLAETYDLLGEVSLESENYSQAAEDLESSLKLKNELFPLESPLISEAHFKISLAYEFSNSEDSSNREKAISHTEKAIESIKLRSSKSGETKEEDTSLVVELEQRLKDLNSIDRLEEEQKKAIKGMLGLDAKPENQLPGSQAPANDISGLIRKKPAKKGNGPKKARIEPSVPSKGSEKP